MPDNIVLNNFNKQYVHRFVRYKLQATEDPSERLRCHVCHSLTLGDPIRALLSYPKFEKNEEPQ